MPVVADAIVGFWSVEVKPLGPAQTWLVPPVEEDVKFIVPPTNTGELLPAVAPVGTAFTVAEVVAIAVHPALVTTT